MFVLCFRASFVVYLSRGPPSFRCCRSIIRFCSHFFTWYLPSGTGHFNVHASSLISRSSSTAVHFTYVFDFTIQSCTGVLLLTGDCIFALSFAAHPSPAALLSAHPYRGRPLFLPWQARIVHSPYCSTRCRSTHRTRQLRRRSEVSRSTHQLPCFLTTLILNRSPITWSGGPACAGC